MWYNMFAVWYSWYFIYFFDKVDKVFINESVIGWEDAEKYGLRTRKINIILNSCILTKFWALCVSAANFVAIVDFSFSCTGVTSS